MLPSKLVQLGQINTQLQLETRVLSDFNVRSSPRPWKSPRSSNAESDGLDNNGPSLMNLLPRKLQRQGQIRGVQRANTTTADKLQLPASTAETPSLLQADSGCSAPREPTGELGIRGFATKKKKRNGSLTAVEAAPLPPT